MLEIGQTISHYRILEKIGDGDLMKYLALNSVYLPIRYNYFYKNAEEELKCHIIHICLSLSESRM